MRVFPLHGVMEVAFDPFAPGALVGDAACAGVFGGTVGFDEEVGDVGEEEDGHFCCWRKRVSGMASRDGWTGGEGVPCDRFGEGSEGGGMLIEVRRG